jgi:hypothetical protein
MARPPSHALKTTTATQPSASIGPIALTACRRHSTIRATRRKSAASRDVAVTVLSCDDPERTTGGVPEALPFLGCARTLSPGPSTPVSAGGRAEPFSRGVVRGRSLSKSARPRPNAFFATRQSRGSRAAFQTKYERKEGVPACRAQAQLASHSHFGQTPAFGERDLSRRNVRPDESGSGFRGAPARMDPPAD